MPAKRLPILTIRGFDEARFECVYPTCGGVCCKNGRPDVEPGEAERIAEHLERFTPHLRPAALHAIRAKGFLSSRTKEGRPMLRVVDGWCVFHADGCVLHKVGAAEGDRFRYKPWRCAVFPLDQKPSGQWYVRQHGKHGEAWDLFCLAPDASERRASETLTTEAELASALDDGGESWRKKVTA